MYTYFFWISEYEFNSPFIIREDEYAKPLPPPKPIQSSPISRPVPPPPPPPPRRPSTGSSFSLASGTAEAVSPYGSDDSLTAPSLTAPVITLEDVQTSNSDEYVRLVATPPKQVKTRDVKAPTYHFFFG